MKAQALQRPTYFWILVVASVIIFYNALPKHAYRDIREVSAVEAFELVDGGAAVIDVRDHVELKLPGAFLIREMALESGISRLGLAKSTQIVVYCGDGSVLGPRATETLNRAGYSRAVNLKDGFQGWKTAGYPTVKAN